MSTSNTYLRGMAEFVTIVVVGAVLFGLITFVLYLVAGELNAVALRLSFVALVYLLAVLIGYKLIKVYRASVRDAPRQVTTYTATPTIDNAPPPLDRLPLYPSTFEASGPATDALLAKIRAFEDAGIDSEMPQR